MIFSCHSFSETAHRFRSGNPFNTEAIPEPHISEVTDTPRFFRSSFSDNKLTITVPLNRNDQIYGMGQSMGGLNKRGRRFNTWCSDDPNHTPDKEALYGSHPFLIIDGMETFGLFLDFPGEMNFDIGYTNPNVLEIHIPSEHVDIYEFTADSKKAIVRDFRRLIGQPYVPPRWGFGYQQCRWSYDDAQRIDEVVQGFRDNDIPCDTVYMDIDYMVDFKDFSIDEQKFPNFSGWIQDKKAQGIRLIPIIDAGVRIEEGYKVYEEGVEKGYFCKTDNGDLFKGAVWPGLCAFPDFFNPEARQWFGCLYKGLTDQGIDGFWNDMNEPALFYTPCGLDQAIDTVSSAKGKNIGIYDFFGLKDSILNMANSREDYRSFYHEPAPGQRVNHEEVHNLYGTNMTRAAHEGFEQIDSDKRFLMFSRASSVGAHRYGGIWFGDNHSWWEHLKLNLQMLPGANFCGFLYSGSDIGGFGANASAELVVRWTQLGAFTPLMRNHAALDTRSQEPFAFDKHSMSIMREHIKLRYRMVSHLYSEYMKAVHSNDALFYPLSFEFDDQQNRKVEDQLLLGDSLMIAPVYEQNARGRYVYLPEDMLLWKVQQHDAFDMQVVTQGHHYLDVALEQLPLFIRKDRMLPLTESSDWVEQKHHEFLDVVVYLDSRASHTLYHDDGLSKQWQKGHCAELKLTVTGTDNKPVARAERVKGTVPWKEIHFHIYTNDGSCSYQTVKL